MKTVLTSIVAAIVALSFSAVVFGADATPAPAANAPAPVVNSAPTPAVENQGCGCNKKAEKKTEEKKEAPAAPAAK